MSETISSKEGICTCPVCRRLHRYLANNPPPVISGEAVIISRAQYEALRGAADALVPFDRWYELNDCNGRAGVLEVPITDLRNARDALAALRSAGIEGDKMSDIVERLRRIADYDIAHLNGPCRAMLEAADEIERKDAEIERLMTELEQIRAICKTAAKGLRGDYAPRYDVAKLLDEAYRL